MRSAVIRTDRYARGSIVFHWTIAVAILLNLAIGIGHDAMPRGWGVMPLHKSLGITVLVLTLARLAWRLVHRPPPLHPDMPVWERLAANASHWALYAFSILVPLTGWAMVSGGEVRRPLDWFGLFPIPYLPVSQATAGAAHEGHEVLGYALLALVVLHTLAALRHHLILRDSTLVRMLPILRAPTPR
ncbi:cytochrome B [Sphingomonas sp. Leaf33]|uniref:cytochrome b n=1 Tax=Sphingomonas sp. Leaf33 TaxID=1736215 RepID=UPI0006FCEAA7|nr:cytochrome b [Sphingomonas sp. Leaf33]KQN19308.1 cytochrome B [Sphingomonas sp. Leaf33]